MSSSDELFDWNVFSEREVPFEVELVSPASEAHAILQRSQTTLAEAQQAVEYVRSEYVAALVQQAVLVTQLAAALDRYSPEYHQASLAEVHQSLRIIKDQMLDELENAGLEVTVPLGKSFKEVSDVIRVDGWRHHINYSSEVVAEVFEPIISHRGKIVHLGRVLMGAPLAMETRTRAASDKDEQSSEGREK
jgi:hypothetical protein